MKEFYFQITSAASGETFRHGPVWAADRAEALRLVRLTFISTTLWEIRGEPTAAKVPVAVQPDFFNF